MEVAKKPTPPPISLLFFLHLLFAFTIQHCECQVPSPPSGGGEWNLLQANIGISVMHMQLLPSNKVVMFDRTDFGPSNLSLPFGRCRYDSSDLALDPDCTAHSVLYDLSSNSHRPLTILTDTWCSSGALLPNGTLLQSGGYNDGDRAVRSLNPCLDISCDWVERPGYLTVRRWYATNQLLPDGRIIILGGRRQFSYEFFPTSSTTYRFLFLRETLGDGVENNLYPFLHLLPDGTLFIFANTRSLVLDYVNNRIVRRLPEIPGGEPRNYPSSGSSVLLPLRLLADGSDYVGTEVLICGGAPRESYQHALNGTFLPALRTCGRLAVMDPEATWTMETMPMSRVMGDMLLLPTGEDVLIINGAGSGTAGWELARNPVTSPVLYRPYEKGPDRRFLVLNPSSVPRLYHSSAVVDSYGRVLVGGSNPHVYYNFTGVAYPTELRLEAFNPPYMAETNAAYRPRIVGVEPAGGVVSYGKPVAMTFEVDSYQSSKGISVVMMAPSFTTHALAMNQRLVVLAAGSLSQVGPVTYRVSTAAPPTATIAPPGYYLVFLVHGGVPSQGVWLRVQ